MSKIRYEKEMTGKFMGRGGPRDAQARQKAIQDDNKIRRFVDSESAYRPKIIQITEVAPQKPAIDLSQYIPLNEMRKKLEEAVEFTRKEEQSRFDSGIRNLNDQLNKMRIRLADSQKELADKNMEKIIRITELETQLKTKEEIYGQVIGGLQEKLDRLYIKISDGSIRPLVGSLMGRPELEDKIFIDPLGPGDGRNFDSHIEIKEESSVDSGGADITTDVDKLRKLLKKG